MQPSVSATLDQTGQGRCGAAIIIVVVVCISTITTNTKIAERIIINGIIISTTTLSFISKMIDTTTGAHQLIIKDKAEVPYLAAGGIDESNFEDALCLNNCIGIDVCSSVEDVPGIKNHSKVENLINKVRSIHV